MFLSVMSIRTQKNPSIEGHQDFYPANRWLHFLSLLYFVFIQISNCYCFIFTITVSYLSLPHQPKLIVLLTKICSFLRLSSRVISFRKPSLKMYPPITNIKHYETGMSSQCTGEYEVLNCFAEQVTV